MTTNRSKRTAQQWGGLKTMLVVGSLAATLAGTRLLGLQESAQASLAETAVNTSQPVTVVVPAAQTSTLPLPPHWEGSSRGVQVELAPIPQAVTPNIQPVQPVARSRSSR